MGKVHVPVAVVEDDFKYWEYVWPRVSFLFGPTPSTDFGKNHQEAIAAEYAFLCHHHDKCVQYRDRWEELGVPWRWAVMVYMLSFAHYKGDRSQVGEWVGYYAREILTGNDTLPYFEQTLEQQFLKDDLEQYEARLLEVASRWLRGELPTIHTSSSLHSGHSVLKKMQIAKRVASTLKGVTVMHCWRHPHGELTPSSHDFVTQLTFPKWNDA